MLVTHLLRRRRSLFGYRNAFTGERRLIHQQIPRLPHHGIRRDNIAGFQLQDIARDNLFGGHFLITTIAPDGNRAYQI